MASDIGAVHEVCAADTCNSPMLSFVQFGQAVSLVGNMVKAGRPLDTFTFTAILNACQRSNEAQVALEVFR